MILENQLTDKILKLNWTIEEKTRFIINNMITTQQIDPSSIKILFCINNRPIGMANIEDISNFTSALAIDINLQACPIVFDFSVIIVASKFSTNILLQNSNKNIIITEEKKKINLKHKYLSCGIQEKTSKISTNFEWTEDLNIGLTLSTANDLLTTWKQFKPFYWDDLFILTISFEDYLIENSKIQLAEYFYETLFTNCYCIKHHGDFTGVSRGTYPKCIFNAPSVYLTTNSENTDATYVYIIVAVTPKRLLISEKAQIKNAPSELNTLNFITLTWEQIPDATEYRIYRISTISTGGSTSIQSGLCNINKSQDFAPPSTTFIDNYSGWKYLPYAYGPTATHFYLQPRKYKWKLTATISGTTITKTGIINVIEE